MSIFHCDICCNCFDSDYDAVHEKPEELPSLMNNGLVCDDCMHEYEEKKEQALLEQVKQFENDKKALEASCQI